MAENRNHTGGGLDDSCCHVGQRGLARTARSDQRDAFARAHRNGDAVECNDVSVSDGEIRYGQWPLVGVHGVSAASWHPHRCQYRFIGTNRI